MPIRILVKIILLELISGDIIWKHDVHDSRASSATTIVRHQKDEFMELWARKDSRGIYEVPFVVRNPVGNSKASVNPKDASIDDLIRTNTELNESFKTRNYKAILNKQNSHNCHKTFDYGSSGMR